MNNLLFVSAVSFLGLVMLSLVYLLWLDYKVNKEYPTFDSSLVINSIKDVGFVSYTLRELLSFKKKSNVEHKYGKELL